MDPATNLAETVLAIGFQLTCELKALPYSNKVEYVYDPVCYAYNTHSNFTHKFCRSPKKILFVGMNPGPWGMSQNGVPFGEVNIVKDWMQITGYIDRPAKLHPSRPILGLQCHRSEPSGKKFWGFFRKLCGEPENFFNQAFVYNYCPLAFLSSTGKNITPAEFKAEERKLINSICDKALLNILRILETEIIIGIGRYAEERAKAALEENNLTHIHVLYIPHPSPRNLAHKNWEEEAMKLLSELDLVKYFIPTEVNVTENKVHSGT